MRRDRIVLLLLLTLTLGAFARVIFCDFVNYDDNDYVTANAIVQRGLTWEGLAWAFGNLHGDKTYWHPLTWLSHMLDCQLFGLRPAPHHLMSLLFHALNVALLFLVLKRMTGSLWRSAVVAAFWAVHPLQVDSVAWITERKNLLSTSFWLLTMAAYVRYAEKPGALRYLLVLAGMALGLMCKPVLVTLPCALLLLDFWPLGRFGFARRASAPGPPAAISCPVASAGRLFLEKVPLLAMAGVVSWITVSAHAGLNITQASSGLPVILRVENAIVSYARYLKKVVWPNDLAVLYPHPGVWPAEVVWGSAFLLLAIMSIAVWRARREPAGLVGWLWFLGVLVPAIGILQIGIQAMADRFIYQPLIGLLVALVWVGAEWAGDSRLQQKFLRALTVMALLGCTLLTWRQIGFWKDSIRLYEHAIEVTRNNYVIESNLAFTLRDAGRLEEARAHALAAVQANPNHFPSYLLLALISEEQNRPEAAAVFYQKALAFQPRWPDALKGYGKILVRLGRPEEARVPWDAAAALVPLDPEIQLLLGSLLAGQRKPAEAILHYREATRLAPQWPQALNDLAWLLATQPDARYRDGAEAVRLAERACTLSQRRQTLFLGTLAAAYAEAGRFDEAVQTAEQAIATATAAKESALATTNARLLEFYRARKPYRDE